MCPPYSSYTSIDNSYCYYLIRKVNIYDKNINIKIKIYQNLQFCLSICLDRKESALINAFVFQYFANATPHVHLSLLL